MSGNTGWMLVAVALLACMIMLLSSFSVLASPLAGAARQAENRPVSSAVIGPLSPEDLSYLKSAPSTSIFDNEPGVGEPGAAVIGPATVPLMHVLLTLSYSNQASLSVLLAGLSDPSSPLYHKYLTASQFDAAYSPPAADYSTVVGYISSYGVSDLTTFADRETVSFEAPSSAVEAMFHTTILNYRLGGEVYYAPASPPEFPSPIAPFVSAVEGLSSFETATSFVASELGPSHRMPLSPVTVHSSAGAYLAPPTVSGVQYEYGPDLQVAYDEQSLFDQYGYPTDEVVATILWSGEYTGGGTGICTSLATDALVGPFVPSDVYGYYNETLPAGEPHSHVQGVPLNGAPYPAETASCDNEDAVLENTLDLEMVGSLAPGSSIYNVYGPNGSFANLDQAFATILSPGAGEPAALNNVTVISNSWGAAEQNDTSWYQDLEQAQARGITVLACSGDSGDDPSTTWIVGDVFTPAAQAYDAFGDTAVGGTTLNLDPTSANAEYLHITGNPAWYNKAVHWGSSGGISTIFPEPSYQTNTEANSVIKSAGRGDPDLGAIANNTLVTLSIDGVQYKATNASGSGQWYYVYGTSIATPVEGGVVAEMDHVLKASSEGPLGYLNPLMYQLANSQYTTCPWNATTDCLLTGTYNLTIPTLPFIDCDAGGNYAYSALPGYDLVTGWGAIDAYNYTMYFLTADSAGVIGRFSGVDNVLNLTALKVSSAGKSYNASIQQNFFLANSLGAPIYWIQNVIYIAHTTGGWAMNFTGWVIFPFWGIYSANTTYRYNWPLSGAIVNTPVSFNISTTLSQGTGFNGQYVTFAFGDGQKAISLPTPGGSYIIGSLWYNYSWQGVTEENGPFPDNTVPGGLDPQLGVVGGPSGGTGDYKSPTAGSMFSEVEPWGTTTWIAAATESFTTNVDQTGESASGLKWTATGSPGSWTLGTSSGSTTQGVLSYDPRKVTEYNVTFNETGLSTGTSWSVTLGGITSPSTGTSDVFKEANGTYTYTLGTVAGYTATPTNGTVVVNGKNPSTILITFTSSKSTLSSVSVTPTSATIGTGATQVLTSKLTCTSTCPAGATYSWTMNVSGLGTLNATTTSSVTFKAGSSPGHVAVFVNATLGGATKGAESLITISGSVNSLKTVTISPSTAVVQTNGTQAFSVTSTCTSGTCPAGLTYAWSLNNSALGSLNASAGTAVTLTVGPTAGALAVKVTGTLGSTNIASQANVTIQSAAVGKLTSVAVSPASTSVQTGKSITLNATATCTTSTCPSGISYSWTLSNSLGNLSTPVGTSITFTAGSKAGSSVLTVNASLNGVSRLATADITISSTVVTTITSVSLSETTVTLAPGGTQVITATPKCSPGACPTSGVGYKWSLNNSLGSLSGGSGASPTFTAGSSPGVVTLTVNATLNGTSATAKAVITITTTELTGVSLSETTATVEVGQSLSITASASCTTSPCPSGVSYAWVTNNSLGSVSPSTGSSTVFTAGASSGALSLEVTATLNGLNKTAAAAITISSSAVPALTGVSLNYPTASVTEGSTQVFTATPSCTPSPCPSTGIAYAWSLNTTSYGSVSGGTTSSTTFTAGQTTGSVTLTVTATYNGASVHTTSSISVTQSTTSATPFYATTAFIGVLLAIIVVAAIAAVLIASRRKKKGAQVQQETQPPQYGNPYQEPPAPGPAYQNYPPPSQQQPPMQQWNQPPPPPPG